MAAAVTIRYEDDTANPIALLTAVHVEATGLTLNETQTSEGVDEETLADPITYYIRGRCTGVDDLISPRFQGPGYVWDDVIFPAEGSWVVTVRKDSDDSQVATHSVTVDALEG